MNEAYWLPVIFLSLMGLSMLIYAVLDGYDLGVGMLLPIDAASEHDRDTMIASIGPFWDANETWLVLAVGLMLIAFPAAHSLVFYHLYLPAALMLIGLILRGVAFDFRAKAVIDHKLTWDRCFRAGSLITSLTQGYMLGLYVVGFEDSLLATGFALISAVFVTASYCYIGAAWLVLKTEGQLQQQAIWQARLCGRLTLFGVIAVCLVNPLVNYSVYEIWFSSNVSGLLWALPVVCLLAFVWNDRLLSNTEKVIAHSLQPMLLAIAIFVCCLLALGASFYPDVVPGRMTVWEAASAPESLKVILVGTVIVVPVIIAYTAFAYWVFRGKASDLRYH